MLPGTGTWGEPVGAPMSMGAESEIKRTFSVVVPLNGGESVENG